MNRGVPLYTEVSSFQGVGIEEFHYIQGCPHRFHYNRVYTCVHPITGCYLLR